MLEVGPTVLPFSIPRWNPKLILSGKPKIKGLLLSAVVKSEAEVPCLQ